MTLKNERINLGRGIYLNVIENNKFKSNLLSYYFIRPLKRSEMTYNALIPLVLKRGTENYPTNLELERKIEELYGASLNMGITKRGEKQVTRISMQWVAEEYLKEEGLDKEVVDLLREIVYNPYKENGVFKSKHVQQEKDNLSKIIRSQVNNKRNYAIQKAISAMCRNERYGLSPLGDLGHMKDISNSKLYSHYEKVLNTSQIEIFYIGNIDRDLVEYIKEINKTERTGIIEIPDDVIISSVQTKNLVMETMDINQGKLVIGYRSGIKFKDKLYNPLLVANNIFGGGPSSKLFENVREKESLAYYISSTLYRQKSMILVDAGIEFEDYNRTLDIIREQLLDLKEGKFTEEDIQISKQDLISSLDSIEDSLYLISEFFIGKILAEDDRSIEKIKEDYKSVKYEDIVKAAQTIDMDTIYFLANEKK